MFSSPLPTLHVIHIENDEYVKWKKGETVKLSKIIIKNRLLDSVGKGEGGMIWENSIETYTIICEINRQLRFDAWGRVLRTGAVGWPWRMGWGGRVRMGNTCTPMADLCAAKSLQSCPTLWDPIDGRPPGSPVPGILQARSLEWVSISFSNAWKWKVKVKSLSRVRPSATPWTTAFQAPPSMGFSRQEYWSGVPLPSPWMYVKNLHNIVK